MRITVVTPSIRPNLLKIVDESLKRQTFTDFEWLVVSPEDYGFGTWIKDPPKESYFYLLNHCWNKGVRQAKGELFVSIVDGMWFPPSTLEVLWNHYQKNPMSCISLTGHQYDKVENGKPEILRWVDPRVRENESFYEIPPYDLELCIASIPIKAIKDVGGFDEYWDNFPAWSEKDLACRVAKLGYKCHIDQSVQYRAIYHEKLSSNWDNEYPRSTEYFMKCYREIQEGKRLRLAFI